MENTRCYHCDDSCEEEIVVADGHSFCCNGCKTVYQLLSENGLNQYYSQNPSPGSKAEESDLNLLAFLDNPEVQDAFYSFQDGTNARVTFKVPIIHCSSCVFVLEHLPKLNPAIKQAQVNFPQKTASIFFDQSQLSLRQLVELLIQIGYRPELDLSKLDKQGEEQTSDRSLLIKLGVAGFCFGNIMMFSFPEYLGSRLRPDEQFMVFFNYLNFILALPVLLYAGADYLRSAAKGLSIGKINMDVPIAIGMLAIFIRSTYDIFSGTGTGYMDSLSGFVFFLLIGKWYQAKTYSSLAFERDYRSFFPIAVKRILTKGDSDMALIKDLEKGDVIEVKNAELIPADSLVLKGNARIDYSFVTGESEPVKINEGERIYAGGKQKGALLTLQVIKPVSSSYLTSLWNAQTTEKEYGYHSLKEFSDKVATWFSLAVLIVATATGIYWWVVDPSIWMNAVSSVLIIACPCALALSIPFTFGSMIRYFGRNGLFVNAAESIDRMGRVTDIVFDKTGTITVKDNRSVGYVGDELTKDEWSALITLASQSGHPLSTTIAEKYADQTVNTLVDSYYEEVGKGISGTVSGLDVALGNHEKVGWSGADSGINETRVYASVSGIAKGFFRFANQYRNGVEEVVGQLAHHHTLHLLSGDNDSEAKHLASIFNSQNLHFNLKPDDKQKWILSKAAEDRKVMMVGDGLNDAGALKESFFGISVADDVHQFTPASDAILHSKAFGQLPAFVELAAMSRKVVWAAFAISLSYNIIGMSVAVQGILSPIFAAILMPLSSVSIVLFTTITSGLMARMKLRS